MPENFPADVRYTETNEWVRLNGDEAVFGVTAYAAEQLGDVTYLQLPDVGRTVAQGEAYGAIESWKAMEDLNAPVSGEVVAANHDLDDHPEIVNDDPYGAGWIARVRVTNPQEYESLLDAAAYEKSTLEH